MYRAKHCLRFVVISLILITAIGCSGKGNSIVTYPGELDATVTDGNKSCGRMLWGIWNISFEQTENIIDIVPARDAQAHFNITDMLLPPECDDCFEIAVNSFDPVTRILDADVTLRNPAPLSGHDVRGILYTNDYGHELRNTDDWTDLWEMPGGMDINPFRAFAKDVENRVFAGDAEHTENYLIYIPQPPNYWAIQFAVDASWPGNCKEPYSIENFIQDGELYDVTSSMVELRVDVLDWQDDVTEVWITQLEIFGSLNPEFEFLGGTTWNCTVENTIGAAPGDYTAIICASSPTIGSNLYDFVTIVVSKVAPDNSMDVTPPWLNFLPNDVGVYGDYVFVASRFHGMHIFDISDPENPAWSSMLDTPGEAHSLDIVGDYAYVADGYGGLHIVDISDPCEAFILKTVETSYCACGVVVKDGIACIADGLAGFSIVDVDPPESAHFIKNVNLGPMAFIYHLDAEGGYAYVAAGQDGLKIIDCDPPEEAYVVTTVDVEHYQAMYVAVQDGLAYAGYQLDASSDIGKFHIIDVDQPETPSLVKELIVPGVGQIVLSGDHAYMTTDLTNLSVINVTQPETAYVEHTVNLTDGGFGGFCLHNGYAYMANAGYGLVVADIDPLGSAYLTNILHSPGYAKTVDVAGDYAYTSGSIGLHILNVSQPEFAFLENWVKAYARGGIDGTMDYAYTTGFRLLTIVDVNPVESAEVIKAVDPWVDGEDVMAYGGYAYVAAGSDGLMVVDIDPPESADVVKTIPTPDDAMGVYVSEGYAFVACVESGLQVIDIDPLDTATIIHYVDTPGEAVAVDISGGYAYVADDYGGLQIIDINPPGSASIIHEVAMLSDAVDVTISGEYAYIAVRFMGMEIVDIASPGEAFSFSSYNTFGITQGVSVSENYAYLADGNRGLRIIKLW